MRKEFRDGQWVELRERINHGQKKELMRAVLAGRDDQSRLFDYETVLVRVFIDSWLIRDTAGEPIDLDDADAIDRAPDDIVEALFETAQELYEGATVPNPPTPEP